MEGNIPLYTLVPFEVCRMNRCFLFKIYDIKEEETLLRIKIAIANC